MKEKEFAYLKPLLFFRPDITVVVDWAFKNNYLSGSVYDTVIPRAMNE